MAKDKIEMVEMGGTLAALQKQLAAEQLAAEQAKSSISDQDRDEIELRNKIAQAKAEREAAVAEQRDLDLSRRLDAATAAHPKAHLGTCVIEEYGDTFILKHNAGAFSAWQKGIAKSVGSKKFDREKNERDYVVKCVIDWNGLDLSRAMSPGGDLVQYLTAHPGICSTLANVASELAGVALDARKS